MFLLFVMHTEEEELIFQMLDRLNLYFGKNWDILGNQFHVSGYLCKFFITDNKAMKSYNKNAKASVLNDTRLPCKHMRQSNFLSKTPKATNQLMRQTYPQVFSTYTLSWPNRWMRSSVFLCAKLAFAMIWPKRSTDLYLGSTNAYHSADIIINKPVEGRQLYVYHLVIPHGHWI